MQTPRSYRSTKARALYMAWAVVVWTVVVVASVNGATYPELGTLMLLALTSALLGAFGVRAWRLALEIWPDHVMIRNLFRSYHIPASDLRAVSFDGSCAVGPGMPGQALEVECLELELAHPPYSVDVTATMWLPAHERRALLQGLKQMMKKH